MSRKPAKWMGKNFGTCETISHGYEGGPCYEGLVLKKKSIFTDEFVQKTNNHYQKYDGEIFSAEGNPFTGVLKFYDDSHRVVYTWKPAA